MGRLRGPEDIVEAVGDEHVELGEEVAVAVKGDLGAAVTHAELDGFDVRALGDGEGHGRVAEIVEPHALEADCFLSRLPEVRVEAGRMGRVASEVGKHQAVGPVVGEALDVAGELVGQARRNSDPPPARPRLRWLANPLVLLPHELFDDDDHPLVEFDIDAAKPDQLTPTESRIAGGQDHHAQVLRQFVGQPMEFVSRQEAHLLIRNGGCLDVGARRLGEELVLDSDIEHPSEYPEMSMHGTRRDLPGKFVSDPFADIEGPDVTQALVSEAGQYIALEIAAVGLDRRGIEIVRGLEKKRGPFVESDLTGLGIDPVATVPVGFSKIEEPASVALGVEGAASASVVLVAVAGAPSAVRCALNGGHVEAPGWAPYEGGPEPAKGT